MQLREATKRYRDFTGHRGDFVEDFPAPDGVAAVGVKFGALDFLGVISPDGKRRWIDFRGKNQPGLGASYDGRQLYVLGHVGAVQGIPGKNNAQGLALGTIFAVAYTTKRDGRIEAYRHDFRPHSRPRLTLNKRGFLILAGGAYQFKDTGINDI